VAIVNSPPWGVPITETYRPYHAAACPAWAARVPLTECVCPWHAPVVREYRREAERGR
jgi:hypothetical protein